MGFQHPNQFAHKLSGWKAASRSSKTPAHLKPHLEKHVSKSDWEILSEDDDWPVSKEENNGPEKGQTVKLRNGKSGTVVYAHPKMRLLRVKLDGEDSRPVTVHHNEIQN